MYPAYRLAALVLALATTLAPAPAASPVTPRDPLRPPVPIVPSAGPQFFAITVADVDASARFYGETFGLTVRKELKPADGSYHVIILGSDRLVVELGHGRDFRGTTDPTKRHLSAGIFKVGFYVVDLPGVVAALETRGIHPVVAIFEERELGIRSAVIADNEGNEIQLFEVLPPGK